MNKLLTWGDELFLLRCELGKLQIQRVGVDVEEKKVSLHFCNGENEAVALPVDARLVAANEVEDSELTIRYPVLVFLSSQEAAQSLSATGKRRRSIKNNETTDSDNNALLRPRSWLFFWILYHVDGIDEIQLQFLNILEVPTPVQDKDTVLGKKDANMLQLFLLDGPHVLLFERRSQQMTLLELQRATQGDESVGFLKAMEVVHGMGDDAPEAFEVVSCTYMSELYSTRPHMLIHTLWLPSSSSPDRHSWSVVDFDYDRGECISRKEASLCHYLPVFSSTTGCNGPMSKPEQITCCCFIFEMNERAFIASPFCDTDAFTSWDLGSRTRSIQTSIGVSTLVVTGTTSNTIYVHANGILLVSYVLPTQPAEIWPLCEDNLDQRYVLCVRCDDENRSFFMLRLSSNVQNVSVELLLSFKHVGHAQNGNFAGTNAFDRSTQVLLLNDVRGIFGINDYMYTIGNEADAYKSLDHNQLVKRSVLVSQKSSSPEIKLSCHRLRLHEEKKVKHGSRSCKRSRKNEDVSLDGSKAEPFRYIERTQKAVSRDKSVNHSEPVEDGAANILAASRAQLGKLAGSLSARLSNGLQELERLQIIVSDKVSLAHQLNQLIVQLWQELQARARYESKEHLILLPSFSAQEVDSHYLGSQGRVDMETIASATIVPQNGTKDGIIKQVPESAVNDLKLEQRVSLKQLTVLKYVPSSSLVHAEVVLTNLSDFVFYDSYVSLTAPTGGQTSTQGWQCSSSVVPKFSSARGMTEHTTRQQQEATFQLEFQFAPNFLFLRKQRPFEVMLWLHWGSSQDNRISNATLAWHPSESALAIASVKMYPEDLVGIDKGLQKIVGSGGGSTFIEQKQLLFISSGSNLVSWFEKPSFKIPTSIDSVIQPTFALICVNVRSRDSMLYELSRIVAHLPLDVYVMHNPFQDTDLLGLQRVLRFMRREIFAQDSQDNEKIGKNHGAGEKHKERTQKAEDCNPASIYRAMQRDTDLHVNRLLQRLQKRVDFHSMWFDAGTNSI